MTPLFPTRRPSDLFGNLRDFVMSPFSGDDGELDSSEIADIQNQYNAQRDGNRRKAGDLGFDGDYRPVIGRAHIGTPVTNAHLLSHLLHHQQQSPPVHHPLTYNKTYTHPTAH